MVVIPGHDQHARIEGAADIQALEPFPLQRRNPVGLDLGGTFHVDLQQEVSFSLVEIVSLPQGGLSHLRGMQQAQLDALSETVKKRANVRR